MAKNNSATYDGYSAKDASDKVGDIAQSTASTLQAGLAKTMDLLITGYVVAQEQLKRGKKQTEKGLTKAQDILSKGTQTAGKSLVKVTDNVKDMQDTFQNRLERYQRRRARAKKLFRVGVVSGVVLALLFTPWPGSETRRQLGETWQQLAQLTQKLFARFTS